MSVTVTPAAIEPVRCAGTPQQIGAAQGAALAERVRACHRSLRDLEAFRLMKPRWLPHAAFVRIAERRATAQWRRAVAPASPDMAARVDAIADAAGMRRGALHLLNVLEPVMADLGDQTVVPPLGGCSSLAVNAERSASGEPVITHNFDYLALVQPFYVVRDTRPAGGLRSLDFTVAPLGGAVDGVNEAGLAITCDYAYVTDGPAAAGTVSMAIAEALARCRTTDEAAAFVQGRARWGGGLLMLADAAGDVASLELSNGRSALRRPGPGDGGVVFHTNRFQSASMQEVELPGDARYTGRAPTALRGRRVHASACARDARFAALLAGDASITPERLAAIMADHGDGGQGSPESICMHGDYWTTTATLQLWPRSRRVRVAFAPGCGEAFTDFEVGPSPG